MSDADSFTRILVAESLFYDQEYGALGSLSLIDPGARRERYLASFMPEDGTFVVEEATAWEEDPPEEDEIGYALATGSDEYGSYDNPEEAAEAVLALAREHDLQPSLTLLFEDEAV